MMALPIHLFRHFCCRMCRLATNIRFVADRETDGRTDGQTDDSIMPIEVGYVQQYDRLKTKDLLIAFLNYNFFAKNQQCGIIDHWNQIILNIYNSLHKKICCVLNIYRPIEVLYLFFTKINYSKKEK